RRGVARRPVRRARPGADEADSRVVKLLHTADWHVGKSIKGLSRLAEHEAVLADIVRVADAERLDVVVVAGDVYETTTPSPDAEALVLRTLLDLRETGARVVV